jgi:hypothetical protein
MRLLANPFLHDGRPKSILACLDRFKCAIDPKKFNSYIGIRGDEHQHNINTTTAQAYFSSDPTSEWEGELGHITNENLNVHYQDAT